MSRAESAQSGEPRPAGEARPTADAANRGAPKKRAPYTAIYVLLAAAFIAILNETVMSVAIPVIKADLDITAALAQWVTTAFLLTMAVVIPITGFLISKLTLRRLFLLSQGLFVVGTLIGALSPNFTVVIVGRVIQAAGTAVLLPLLMTTVLRLVPEKSRGTMMGNLSIVIAVAPAIGPTVSGLILKLASNNWHMLFWTMLPIGALALVVGTVLLPSFGERSDKRIDVLSVALSAVGFGMTVYGLSLVGAEAGAKLWLSLGVGLVSLVLFGFRQVRLARTDSALLDLRMFRTKSFAISTALLSIGMLAMFGVIIILPLYLALRGVEVLTIGLMLMPGPLVMGLMGPFVGRLYDKFGPRPLVPPGATMVTLGIFGLSFIGLNTPLWWIVAAHIGLEIGLGLLFTPLFTWGLGDLPQKLYPDGSAVVNTLQQVFGAVGTATFVAISAATTAAIAASPTPAVDETIAGYKMSMWVGVGFGAVAIALSTRVRRTRKRIELE
ncbi:MDR family MFS transporter [Corynebacterium hansenii]|uniref:MDR family MFS transporter n=1 Tax=Corynebacterium hansenii TaxID=394964 RepID=A0ABV7ZSI5_9CORY|nr:MDR family MFS transporter [Corynebacterium hansenii]WJY99784.1 putative transport protein HsrA [Corynebacterium hansenii]